MQGEGRAEAEGGDGSTWCCPGKGAGFGFERMWSKGKIHTKILKHCQNGQMVMENGRLDARGNWANRCHDGKT